VTQALFRRAHRFSPLGLADGRCTPGTKRRTLMNFPEQAGGADMMRLAAIAAHEAGIRLPGPGCTMAFWITAPLAELDDAIAHHGQPQCAVPAGPVAGIDIPVEGRRRGALPRNVSVTCVKETPRGK